MAIPPLSQKFDLQKQADNIAKSGSFGATNRPPASGDQLRNDIVANEANADAGVGRLENFKPYAGDRKRPLIMRYPTELGSVSSDMPHIMQFKIYWRWENPDIRVAGTKLKMESQKVLDDMRGDLDQANDLESTYAAQDGGLVAGAVAGEKKAKLRGALLGYEKKPSNAVSSAQENARGNRKDREEFRKKMEQNMNSQDNRVGSISRDLGVDNGAAGNFGETELSKDTTVLSNRFSKQTDKILSDKTTTGQFLNNLGIRQAAPQYDQMVSIYLPTCSRINGEDAFSYEEVDMSMVTGVLSGFNGMLGGAKKETTKQIALIAGAEFLKNMGAGSGSLAALSQMSGMVMNPRIEKLFKQKDMRQFAFSWDIFPRNQKEVDCVRDIIETFRYHSSPAKSSDNINDPQIMLRVPAEFTVKFLSASTANGVASYEENPHIPKISRCVISSISVDYTPTGVFATLPDNSPVAYTLTIQMSEIAAITREDIQGGF